METEMVTMDLKATTGTSTALIALQDAEQAIQAEQPVALDALALVKATRTALETATTPQDIKEVADRAAAIATYLRRRHGLLREANEIVVVRLEAERKLGSLLIETVKPGSHEAKLPDGISRNKAMQLRTLASIDEHAFDQIIQELRDTTELTTAEVLRQAKVNGSCPVNGQDSRHRTGQQSRTWARQQAQDNEDMVADHEVELTDWPEITAVQLKEAFPDSADAFSHLDDDAIVIAISFRTGAEE